MLSRRICEIFENTVVYPTPSVNASVISLKLAALIFQMFLWKNLHLMFYKQAVYKELDLGW